jgi:hypothetical protein
MDEDRLLSALEMIGGAMVSIAKTMELDYQKKWPSKPVPREAEVTYVKTGEEELREDQGQTGEATVEDWTSLGPRERAFIAGESKK